MGWEGHTVGIQDPAEKKAAVEKAIGLMAESARLCREAGLTVSIVSGGGSGDYTLSSHLGVLTESQAGGATFCDATYMAYGAQTKPSLFVRTMVTSRPTATRIIFDAGFKALPAWARPPIGVGLPASSPYKPSAEHGKVELQEPDTRIRPGDAYDFVVSYGDSTVFLHDEILGIRRGRVEAVWEIEGRGKLT
jgi:D-serine deaminase-like pyridoxal phosphate-dependent protein